MTNVMEAYAFSKAIGIHLGEGPFEELATSIHRRTSPDRAVCERPAQRPGDWERPLITSETAQAEAEGNRQLIAGSLSQVRNVF